MKRCVVEDNDLEEGLMSGDLPLVLPYAFQSTHSTSMHDPPLYAITQTLGTSRHLLSHGTSLATSFLPSYCPAYLSDLDPYVLVTAP